MFPAPTIPMPGRSVVPDTAVSVAGQPSGSAVGLDRRLEDEHRDLPIGLLLVLGVVRIGLDRPLPPLGFLRPGQQARHPVALGRSVLQLDVRVGHQVVVPDGVGGGTSLGGDHRVVAVVLHPHQRALADLPRLGAADGQDDDGHSPQGGPLGPTGTFVLLGLAADPPAGLGSYSPSRGMPTS